MVVTNEPEIAHDIFPLREAVPVTHGAKNPGAVEFVRIALAIEDAVDWNIPMVELTVFGMEMKDCLTAGADRSPDIGPLPEQMARIKITTDFRADCLPQS